MPLTWPELLLELRRGDLLVSAPEQGPTPSALSADSRAIAPGAVYLAVRGSQADGHRFVPDAVGRGARPVVLAVDVVAEERLQALQVARAGRER